MDWRDDLCVVRVSFCDFLDSDGTEPVPPVTKFMTRSRAAQEVGGTRFLGAKASAAPALHAPIIRGYGFLIDNNDREGVKCARMV